MRRKQTSGRGGVYGDGIGRGWVGLRFGVAALSVGMVGGSGAVGQEAIQDGVVPGMPLGMRTPSQRSYRDLGPGGGGVVDDFSQHLSQGMPYVPSQNFPNRDYNFQMGNLRGAIYTSLQAAYSDNVLLSDDHAEGDFSIMPALGIGLSIDLTKYSRLRLDVGLGYNFYLDHSELNYLSASITPNSVLDYSFVVGDVMVVVYDRFTAPNDARMRPEISGGSPGAVNFQRLINTTGTTVQWALREDLTTLAGYGFTIDRSMSDEFTQLDRDTHLFNVAAQYRVNELISTGLYGLYAMTDYVEKIQNDANTYSIGPMVSWRPTKYLEFAASVGYTSTTFDLRNTPGAIQDSSEFSGVTYELSARHRINKAMVHNLSASRRAELGLGSNFSDYHSVTYNFGWELIQDLTLTMGGTYLGFEQSDAVIVGGGEPEHGYLVRAFISAGYPLAKRLNAAATYAHNLKESQLVGRDYSENVVSLTLQYRF